MSTGIVTIATPPRIAIRSAMTTNVYGRRSASLTIHMMVSGNAVWVQRTIVSDLHQAMERSGYRALLNFDMVLSYNDKTLGGQYACHRQTIDRLVHQRGPEFHPIHLRHRA